MSRIKIGAKCSQCRFRIRGKNHESGDHHRQGHPKREERAKKEMLQMAEDKLREG